VEPAVGMSPGHPGTADLIYLGLMFNDKGLRDVVSLGPVEEGTRAKRGIAHR
jgi:hypothetical protein